LIQAPIEEINIERLKALERLYNFEKEQFLVSASPEHPPPKQKEEVKKSVAVTGTHDEFSINN